MSTFERLFSFLTYVVSVVSFSLWNWSPWMLRLVFCHEVWINRAINFTLCVSDGTNAATNNLELLINLCNNQRIRPDTSQNIPWLSSSLIESKFLMIFPHMNTFCAAAVAQTEWLGAWWMGGFQGDWPQPQVHEFRKKLPCWFKKSYMFSKYSITANWIHPERLWRLLINPN